MGILTLGLENLLFRTLLHPTTQGKSAQSTSPNLTTTSQPISAAQREGKSCDFVVARPAAALCTVLSRDRYFLGLSSPAELSFTNLQQDDLHRENSKYTNRDHLVDLLEL